MVPATTDRVTRAEKQLWLRTVVHVSQHLPREAIFGILNTEGQIALSTCGAVSGFQQSKNVSFGLQADVARVDNWQHQRSG